MHMTDRTMPPEADRVIISINPKAGAGPSARRADQLAELLQGRGFTSDVLTNLDEVAGRANRWHSEGLLRALVGVGGDGTAAELVNRTEPGVPVTLCPAGTENLLARYLGLTADPEELARVVATGAILRLDAGRANGRVFLLMASCGFDADVVRRVDQQRTGHITHLTWMRPIFQSIRRYEYPDIRVYWDEADGDRVDGDRVDGDRQSTVSWMFACNLPCYGGGFRVAPDADGTDGLLDACTFRRGSWWRAPWYAAAVKLGRHRQLADFAARRVKRLRVESQAEVPYQLDGDPGGVLPLDIEVLPDRLTLIVPKTEGSDG